MKKMNSDDPMNFQELWDATNHSAEFSTEKFRHLHALNSSSAFLRKAQRFFQFFKAPTVTTEPVPDLDFQLIAALNQRKSTRNFSYRPLLKKDIVALISPCLSLKNNRMGAPSAGALYPLDIYIVCLHAKDLETGIYSWRAGAHDLTLLRPLPSTSDLSKNFFGGLPSNISAIFFLVARVEPVIEKYGLRSFRLLFLEAGHLCQSLWLLATAQKIAYLVRDDFFDQDITRYLALHPLQQKVLTSVMLGGAPSVP
jgi:SagB-type dehydrogenase family enzyme